MSTYAAHLECSILAEDIEDSFPLRDDSLYSWVAERYDSFLKNHASAQHHGLGSEDNARRLLRDAVNVVNDLAMQAAKRGMRHDLAQIRTQLWLRGG